MRVISNIHIIEDNGILDHTIIADIALLKDHGILYHIELRTTKIVSLFAFIAIIISLLGLVAMSTYFIQQRAREIAVRKVFGSTGNQIRLRLIRTFMLYVGIAFVIAVPIIVHFMSKWIEQYSYRIVWWPWIVAAGMFQQTVYSFKSFHAAIISYRDLASGYAMMCRMPYTLFTVVLNTMFLLLMPLGMVLIGGAADGWAVLADLDVYKRQPYGCRCQGRSRGRPA